MKMFTAEMMKGEQVLHIPRSSRQRISSRLVKIPRKKKIYVEDYVFTYIKELAKKEFSDCRIAVLLGHYIKLKNEQIIMINGAVEAEGIQFDAEVVFNNDTWTSIYENIKKYFSDVEVVGWFIGGPGFLLENEEKLKKIHLDNFAGVDKALMKYDSMEQEESFYIYEHGGLACQKGYYIYYEKNEDMQNYIIEHRPSEIKSSKASEEKEVIEYKEEMKEQKVQENTKNIMHLLYAAGSLMVVIVIVAFAIMLNNSSTIKNLEKTVKNLEDTLYAGESNLEEQKAQEKANLSNQVAENAKQQEDTMDVETISGNLSSIKQEEVVGDRAEEVAKKDEKKDTKQEEQAEEPEVKSDNTKSEEKTTDTEKKEDGKEGKKTETKPETKPEKEDAAETSASTSEVKYYEVQKGDTLVGISFKLYQSGDYVTKIMKLNGIEDMDMIYYGQKLIVP